MADSIADVVIGAGLPSLDTHCMQMLDFALAKKKRDMAIQDKQTLSYPCK
jgi:hypothetical protein